MTMGIVEVRVGVRMRVWRMDDGLLIAVLFSRKGSAVAKFVGSMNDIPGRLSCLDMKVRHCCNCKTKA
jgi:hypothetical protein